MNLMACLVSRDAEAVVTGSVRVDSPLREARLARNLTLEEAAQHLRERFVSV
ncbi:hypothetical protein [Kitasatospora sp. NPDC088351]|uniref:hypothetical protein n=1 Tax=Kitasatospora sp. NPDC088351 TaxID=3155180 RepID=UPI003427D20A